MVTGTHLKIHYSNYWWFTGIIILIDHYPPSLLVEIVIFYVLHRLLHVCYVGCYLQVSLSQLVKGDGQSPWGPILSIVGKVSCPLPKCQNSGIHPFSSMESDILIVWRLWVIVHCMKTELEACAQREDSLHGAWYKLRIDIVDICWNAYFFSRKSDSFRSHGC